MKLRLYSKMIGVLDGVLMGEQTRCRLDSRVDEPNRVTVWQAVPQPGEGQADDGFVHPEVGSFHTIGLGWTTWPNNAECVPANVVEIEGYVESVASGTDRSGIGFVRFVLRQEDDMERSQRLGGEALASGNLAASTADYQTLLIGEHQSFPSEQ